MFFQRKTKKASVLAVKEYASSLKAIVPTDDNILKVIEALNSLSACIQKANYENGSAELLSRRHNYLAMLDKMDRLEGRINPATILLINKQLTSIKESLHRADVDTEIVIPTPTCALLEELRLM
jgi:hypothetical protein